MWDVMWSLWFWVLTALIGLQNWFIVIWISTFGLWWYLLIKKVLSYRSKNNERQNPEAREVHELPIPAVDVVTLKIDEK